MPRRKPLRMKDLTDFLEGFNNRWKGLMFRNRFTLNTESNKTEDEVKYQAHSIKISGIKLERNNNLIYSSVCKLL